MKFFSVISRAGILLLKKEKSHEKVKSGMGKKVKSK